MIRHMNESDLDEVVRIEKDVFSSPWSRHSFKGELNDNPYARLYVLEDESGIVGYCDLWIMYEQAQIANIGTRKDCRRRGFGQALMDHMIKEAEAAGCETMSLEVRVSNEPAIALYRKNGFLQANIRKNYYTDNNEDAYLMIKPLGGNDYDNDTGH